MVKILSNPNPVGYEATCPACECHFAFDADAVTTRPEVSNDWGAPTIYFVYVTCPNCDRPIRMRPETFDKCRVRKEK